MDNRYKAYAKENNRDGDYDNAPQPKSCEIVKTSILDSANISLENLIDLSFRINNRANGIVARLTGNYNDEASCGGDFKSKEGIVHIMSDNIFLIEKNLLSIEKNVSILEDYI